MMMMMMAVVVMMVMMVMMMTMMMMMMMIIIKIIITMMMMRILTLKRPGRNRVQITCNTSSAFYLEHIVCYVLRRDSSAIKFDRVEIAFILALSG